MTQVGFRMSAVALSVLLGLAPNAYSDTANQSPDFKEVYDLIRSHLAGATDAELNRASVDGLIAELQGKVSIAGPNDSATTTNLLTSRAGSIDDGIAYVRVRRVAEGLAGQLSSTWRQMNATNQFSGLVLDLRFAAGTDYQAAAAVADLFTTKELPLLDWGDGVVRSKAKSDAITLPVAVLVNHKTSGSAEALAAALRETGTALILGAGTAGNAMVAQEFPLKNGQRLLIPTQPVKAGDGTALSEQGVKPDIEVTVNPEAESRYFEDAFAVIATADNGDSSRATEANAASRRSRISEADLVRERREGDTNTDDAVRARSREPEKPVIRDPALARAVDLLKGLAVVRSTKP